MKRQVKTLAFNFNVLLLLQNTSSCMIFNVASVIAMYVVFLLSLQSTWNSEMHTQHKSYCIDQCLCTGLRTVQILAFSLLSFLNYAIAINAKEQKPIMQE